MNTNVQTRQGTGAVEIALNPNDLRVPVKYRIYEKDSTAGFEEVPEVNDPNGRTVTNGMIQADQPWGVQLRWATRGIFACFLAGGFWKAKLIFELMGGGETNYSSETSTPDLGSSQKVYSTDLQVRPGELRPGVYRVVICLQYCFGSGSPGPIAGFFDAGMIKIYQDHKSEREVAPAANGLAVAAF